MIHTYHISGSCSALGSSYNVNAIEAHATDNLRELVDYLSFPAEAVLPAVVDIFGPTTAHTGATKAKNHLLTSGLEFLNQCLVCGIITDGWFVNLARGAALIFRETIGVTHSKGDHNM